MYSTLALLLLVASFNFIIDPVNIYHNSLLSPEKYAQELIHSDEGLILQYGLLSERTLSKELSKYSKSFDCVIIGSSHTRPIGSHRKNKSLTSLCPRILNLSVSSASIEDHITLSYLVITSGFKGKIILGSDPWVLSTKQYPNWSKYKNDYYKAIKEIHGKSEISANILHSKIMNLINFEYTTQSIKRLKKYLNTGLPSIVHVAPFDHDKGLYETVKLPDGSTIQGKKYSNKIKNSNDYSIPNYTLSPDKLINYERLLKWVTSSGATPYILLTPYHPLVWSNNEANKLLSLKSIEKINKKIAQKIGVTSFGSYNPIFIGCMEYEFSDASHAKDTCLGKISTH